VQQAAIAFGDQIERILNEGRRKLASYGLSSGYILVVTDHLTVASDLVADAFKGIDSMRYSDLGGVFWLDTRLPHRVEALHNSGALFPL
jgi:hypothetical protein